MAERRRQRRRSGGRHNAAPAGGPGSASSPAAGTHPAARSLTAAETAELEGVFDSILGGVPEHLGARATPLAVEAWASELWSICQRSDLGDLDPEAVFAGGLISYASARSSTASLSLLRSLAAVVPDPYRTRAGLAADRMAANGVTEPAWATGLCRSSPHGAWLSHDPVHDDGVSVMVGFDGPAGHDVVGLYVDHNLGGVAKDAFVLPAAMDEVVSALRASTTASGIEFRPVTLAEAASRWRQSLDLTDGVPEAQVTPDVHHLRALIETRLASLPSEPAGPAEERSEAVIPGIDDGIHEGTDMDPHREVVRQGDARRRLLAEFLQTDDVVALAGPSGADGEGPSAAAVQYLASQVLVFSFDHVLGATLRFSPVMAEVFCLDWAPRRIAADRDALALLPHVLVAWIRFAGVRRGIPEEAIEEAVTAVHDHERAMLELAQDPTSWGPAKMMAMTIIERGIDVSDPGAFEVFIDDLNRDGRVDALAALFGLSDPSQS